MLGSMVGLGVFEYVQLTQILSPAYRFVRGVSNMAPKRKRAPEGAL
jgi:hypothetical protein